MIDPINRYVSPPVFKDEEKTRVAGLLHTVLMTMIFLTLLYALLSPVFYRKSLPITGSILVMLPLWLISVYLMHQGHVRQAGLLFLFVLWILVMIVAVFGGGVSAQATTTFIPITLTAGFLFGWTTGVGFFGLCMLSEIGMWYAEISHLLPAPLTVPMPAAKAIGLITNLILAVMLARLVLQSLTLAFERARLSEAKYRLFIQNFQGIAYQISHVTHNVTLFHGSVEKITGYPPELFITGQITWNQLVYPDDLPIIQAEIAKLATVPKYIADHEYRIRRQDGEIRWVRDIAQSMIDEAGCVVFSQGVVYDITERRQAEEEMHHLRNLLSNIINSMPSALIGVDLEGNIVQWNRGAESMTGVSAENAQRRILTDVFPQLTAEVEKIQQAIHNRKPQKDQRIEYRRAGEPHYIDVTVYPLIDKSVEGAVIRIDDVTDLVGIEHLVLQRTEELQRSEDRLKQLNQELEQRVTERTAELQASLEALKHAQKHLVQTEKMAALGALVAGIAHEINTPLGIGVTAASYLAIQAEKLSAQYAANTLNRSDLERYVRIAAESSDMILSNLNRAAKLVKSFKQVAVDQSTEECRRFKLKDYLDDILLSLRPQFKKTRHEIIVNCPDQLEVTSYPGVFSQILNNLLMNSLIHGFDGIECGQIYIDISENSRVLSLLYSDDGRGIVAEHLPKIFDPFFTTKRTQNGTGLGMHIVYNLVTQRLHGTISCESTPGKGVMFQIEIPIDETPSGNPTEHGSK